MAITHILNKPNWNDISLGALDTTKYRAMFDTTGTLRSDNTCTIEDHDGFRCLVHNYTPSTFGTATGINQYPTYAVNATEMWVGFNYKTTPQFDYGILGKFFGMFPGDISEFPPLGTLGKDYDPYVGYARTYWREDGRFEFNVKHHNMCDECTNVTLGLGRWGNMPKGLWNSWIMRGVINTVGNQNGIVQMWINGQLAASYIGMGWVLDSNRKNFGTVMLDSFMGGASAVFSPDIVQKIYQRNMHVWTTDNPIGNTLYTANNAIETPLGFIGGDSPPEPPPPPPPTENPNPSGESFPLRTRISII